MNSKMAIALLVAVLSALALIDSVVESATDALNTYSEEEMERFQESIEEGEKSIMNCVLIIVCLVVGFCLEEVQESLILYGMAPLYAKLPRGAAFIVAFSHRIYDIHDVDAILRENNLPPFLTPDPPA